MAMRLLLTAPFAGLSYLPALLCWTLFGLSVFREKRANVEFRVRDIASSPAGDREFPAERAILLYKKHALAACSEGPRSHHACRTSAHHDGVVVFH